MLKTSLLAFLAVTSLAIFACDKQSDAKNADDIEDQVDEAEDETEDALEEAVDETKDEFDGDLTPE